LRGAEPALPRILAIGDALRTDLAAAAGMGVDALLVAGGLHAGEIISGGAIDPDRLAALLGEPGAPPARAAIAHLRW
jgi:ribonucleotide monophosphatase NagD (HAD superfamily)